MATYQFDGETETAFPTLGVTVKKGDTFEAPEGLVLPDVSIASGKKNKVTEVPAEVPAEETTPENTGA